MPSVLSQSVQEIFGCEDPPPPDEAGAPLNPGLFYHLGCAWVQILKKFLVPVGLGAVAIGCGEGTPVCLPENKTLMRPSELPIYGTDEGITCVGECKEEQSSPGVLESGIGVLRKELWVWYDNYKGYRQKVVEVMEVGKAHTATTLEFLKEEENFLPRAGAIGLGSLTGLVLGLRGGFLRRVFYGTAGGLAMAALCYPREATDLTHESLYVAKRWFVISYNFIYGVTPDTLRFPLPAPVSVPGKSLAVTSEPDVEASSVAEGAMKMPTRHTDVPEEVEIVNKPPGHRDQSNPADKDLYTVRS